MVPLAGLTVATLLAAGLAWSQSPSAPTWPASIAPIAAFVSHDRGLAFLHPVPVHFQSPRTFDQQTAAQDQPDGASQKAQVLLQATEFRALGLLGGSVNLVGAQTALDTGSVQAYYDDVKKDIVIRGANLSPGTKVTLAHELTHVLQDQHFNLVKLDDGSSTADEEFAVTAIEEGDAVVTENDYAASLPVREQREAAAEENAPVAGSTAGGTGTGAGTGTASTGPTGPTGNADFLGISSEVPYILGPDFVLLLYNMGGIVMTNRAFEHPPRSELDIVNPSAYLLHQATRVLPPPALGRGERRIGSPGSFGAFETYMTLAGDMDATTALAAADGWGGGSMTQYRHDGVSCTRLDLVGRTAPQSDALARAFTIWAGALRQREAVAVVTRRGETTAVSACDPGRGATAGPRSREHALDVVDERNANMASAYLYADLSPAVALCVADRSVGDAALLQAEAAQNNSYGAPPKSVQTTIDSQMRDLTRSCRLGSAAGSGRPRLSAPAAPVKR
jgi:hypothetical protein